MKRSFSMASAIALFLVGWAGPPALAGVKVRDVKADTVLREGHASRGKVVVLHLYASWCPPCRAELPVLNRLPKLYRPSQLKLMPLAIDEDTEGLRQFLDALAPNFPTRRLRKAEMVRLIRSLRKANLQFEDVVPYTAIFDRHGRLVEQWSGARDLSSYRNAIDRGLAARPPRSKKPTAPAPVPSRSATTPQAPPGTLASTAEPDSANTDRSTEGQTAWGLPLAVGGGALFLVLTLGYLLGMTRRQ